MTQVTHLVFRLRGEVADISIGYRDNTGRTDSRGWAQVYAIPLCTLRWECSMDQALDIFRLLSDGVCWIGIAENLEAAKALIKAKSAEQPGAFLVVSIETGWKMEIKAPGTTA